MQIVLNSFSRRSSSVMNNHPVHFLEAGDKSVSAEPGIFLFTSLNNKAEIIP